MKPPGGTLQPTLAVFYAVAHSIKERQTLNEVQRKTHEMYENTKNIRREKIVWGL